MNSIKKHLVIIGGTSGIGLATAMLAGKQGLKLTITGLHQDFGDIASELPAETAFYKLDIANEIAVKEFFGEIGKFDYLATPGSFVPKGNFLTMNTEEAKKGFESKFWGQYFAAKYAVPQMSSDGAIVFFSGVISQRPQVNLSVMASVNSAVEGLGRALAIELAPLRVNVIAPGIVDTPRYAGMMQSDRDQMFAQLKQKLPVKHVGQSHELAQAVLFLLTNTYTTGTTLYVDGGHLLV